MTERTPHSDCPPNSGSTYFGGDISMDLIVKIRNLERQNSHLRDQVISLLAEREKMLERISRLDQP